MTGKLTIADIQFMLDNVNFGATPPAGSDPLAPTGIRAIDGTNNNLTGLSVVDQWGNFVDTASFGNVDQAFIDISSTNGPNTYAPSPMTVDASPRVISNLIADTTSANPATAGAALLTQGDAAVDRLPENSLFTFFGQFFDHGLDFISKQGSGVVMIPISPTDPLYDPTPGALNMMPLTRAELDADGNTINTTAPYVEQSQTYGSHPALTFFLMEYDVNGEATGDLIHGAHGGMATWADLKDNANRWARAQAGADPATEMLSDYDILNVPDPSTWDPLANGGMGAFTGPATGQAFSADIAHNAVPFDHSGGALAPDADAVVNENGFGAPPPATGEYDNELLDAHYISGDPRANENVALTAIHDTFHGEHTRILNMIKDWVQQQNQIDPTFAGQWTGEMYFQAAKLANEMQYQHLVFEEFGRRMSPNIDAFASYQVDINPNITTEFSQAVYRFGHSQQTDNVKAIDATGHVTDYTLVDAFLDPVKFSEVGAADFLKGGQFEQGGRIDEFVTDALRNFLVGLPLDLAALNIARGRDIGLPTLNEFRADIFAQTGETLLRPYESWADFGAHLKNPGSLVNFIAAYSNDATIAAARTLAESGNVDFATDYQAVRDAAAAKMLDPVFMDTVANGGDDGFNLVDLWIGGLAEQEVPLGVLGSTFDFVFAQQMIALQNGDRFYYLARIGGNLLDQIEGQTLADLMMRSTGVEHLHGDVFGTPDALIELGSLVADNLLKSPAELQEYISEIIGGTNANNIIQGGAGNDAIYGEGGSDELFGGANDDHVYGGDGNDQIWGDQGFDFLRGDAGDDTIRGGSDDDAIFGGTGNDVLYGDTGFDAIVGGDGDDQIFGGSQDDELLGGEGHDTIEGDSGDDGIDGEAGDDVLSGGRGDDLITGGTGNDMMIGGAGADQFDGGALDHDVVSYHTWLQGQPSGSVDGLVIDMVDPALSTGDARGDTFANIEAVYGSIHDDAIVGNEVSHMLVGGAGNDHITGGLADDVLVGGTGNDTLIGGGAGLNGDTVRVRGNRADFTLSLAIGGFTLTDNETTLTSDEGSDFISNDISWLAFDDQLVNIQSGLYAPLLGLTNTSERSQDGVTLIDQLESNLVINDGTSLAGQGLFVTDLQILDPDGPAGPTVVTLTGVDAGHFTIRNIGGINKLYLTGGGPLSSTNFEVKPSYDVTINVADPDGGSSRNLNVKITDLNDNAPVITSGERANVEYVVDTNTVVYRAQATDVDTTGEQITYSLSGADASAFTLVNGELRFVAAPSTSVPGDADGDNIYDVVIEATDGTNVSQPKNVSIHVQGPPANVVTGTTGDDLPLIGTPGNDIINALAGNDLVQGLDGADIIYGGDGDDGISGFAGSDTIFGGAGVDWIYGDEDNDSISGGLGGDALFGGSGNDLIAGDEGDDGLDGGLGDDTMNGGDGVDWLYGGDGNDSLDGGAGGDALFGDAGDDNLNGSAGDDGLDGGLGNDTLEGGSGVDWLYGGDGDDNLYGSSVAVDSSDTDALFGQAGNDNLWGGAGGDNLDGGIGNDTLNGGDGVDWLYGDDGDDILNGDAGSDALFGGFGNDTLNGGDEGDSLYGEDGNDRLDGGLGIDILEGGAGSDEFHFDNPAGYGDVVTDFVSGTDTITINGSIAGLAHSGVLTGTGIFLSGAALPPTDFGVSTEVIYYDTANGGLWLDTNGGLSDDAVLIAGFQGTPTILESDISIV